MSLEKGFIHIYTGDGKGKTTAAIGLGVRAAGAGLKVYMIQFMKGRRYSEIDAIEKIIPLNGFPVIHAIMATEIRGRQVKSPNNLLDGAHFAIKAAIKI